MAASNDQVGQGLRAGLFESYDNGKTYSQNITTNIAGIDFTDDAHGIALGKHGPTLATTNGGFNWQPIVGTVGVVGGETILSEKGTPNYFAIDWGGAPISNKIYRSTDYGQNWINLSLPATYVAAEIKGIEGPQGYLLFVQAQSIAAGGGLWRSADRGKSWSAIYGPTTSQGWPNARISILDCGSKIFAADTNGGIWMCEDGGDGSITSAMCPVRNIALNATLCDSEQTIFHFRNPHIVDSVYVTEVSILDSTRQPATNGALQIAGLPKLRALLNSDDSISFSVRWNPRRLTDTTKSDSSIIRIITFDANSLTGITYDTFFIPVSLTARSVPPSFSTSNELSLPGNFCVTKDTTVLIHNDGCDTLWIPKHSLRYGLDWSVVDTGLISVAPLSSRAIRLHYRPSSKSSRDTLRIAMWYQGLDTAASISLIGIPHIGDPFVLPTSFSIDSVLPCRGADTMLTVLDTLCGAITILDAHTTGAFWHVVDAAGAPLGFPLAYSDTAGFGLHLNFSPSKFGLTDDTLVLTYRYFDSTFTRQIPLRGSTRTNTLEYTHEYLLNSRSTCRAFDTSVTIVNLGCGPDTIRAADLSGVGFAWLRDSLPIVVQPGDSVRLRVRFMPPDSGVYRGSLKLTVTSMGLTVTPEVQLSGIGIRGAGQLDVRGTSLQAGAFPYCSGDTTLTDTLRNIGCDTLWLKSASVSGDASFTLLDNAPQFLAKDSVVVLHIRFSPRTKGVHTAQVQITWDSAGTAVGAHHAITGVGLPGSKWLAAKDGVATRNFGALHPCESRDTTVTFQNPGCDTLIVDTATMSAQAWRLALQGYPILLPPNGELTVPVYFVPDTSGAPTSISGMLHVFASNSDSAKEIDIPFVARMAYPDRDTLSVVSGDPARHTAGETVRYYLTLSTTVGRHHAFDAISFSITNNDDLLSLEDATGLHLDSTRAAGTPPATRITRYYTLSPIPLSDTISILTYKVYLAGEENSPLHLGDVHFTNSLGLPNDCVASIASADSSFTYIDNTCTDSIVRDMMMTGRVRIDRIVPNPSHGFIWVWGVGFGVGEIEVYDVMGRVVRGPGSVARGPEGGIEIDVRSLPEGVYYLRAGQASARFEVIR